MEEQSQTNKAEEKVNDKINNLEKLMKLERKSVSFDFRDQSLNFQLRITQPKADNYSGTADFQLKMFWRLIESHYFRKIQDPELERLQYLRLLTQSFPKSNKPFYEAFNKFQASKQFWELFQNTYQHSAYKSILQSRDQLQRKNFLQLIYHYISILQQKQLPKNKIKQKLKDLDNIKLAPFQIKKTVNLKQLLEKQSKQLEAYRLKNEVKEQNELDQQIAQLQQQLNDVREFNKHSYENIVKRVKKQRLHRHRFYFANTDEQFKQMDKILASKKASIFPSYFQTNEELHCITEFLKYTIQRVQKAQIAESMGKVLGCQNRNGKYFFFVEFEKGTNIKERFMEQKQILEYDKLRDVSIFKNYKMSMNQNQFIISNNIAGFYDYFHRKISKNDQIQKDYLLSLKKNALKFSKDVAYEEFINRQICHQCKCLFPKSWIMSCKYTSSKQGNPAIPYSYYDPYLDELTKLSINNNQRFSTRKMNSCNGYTKKNDQFICERQYCKQCLDNLYPKRQQQDLCPFCQGICSCTRCSRNQRLIKLKTLYHLYGGDMNDLKPIQFIATNQQQSFDSKINKRGRPKKSKIIQKQPKKIQRGSFFKQKFQQNLRQGLEDARTLASYVKRREVKKQLLYEKMHKLFQIKANIITDQYQKPFKNRSICDENEMPNTYQSRGRKRIH